VFELFGKKKSSGKNIWFAVTNENKLWYDFNFQNIFSIFNYIKFAMIFIFFNYINKKYDFVKKVSE
jgi:hypothetical protein